MKGRLLNHTPTAAIIPIVVIEFKPVIFNYMNMCKYYFHQGERERERGGGRVPVDHLVSRHARP